MFRPSSPPVSPPISWRRPSQGPGESRNPICLSAGEGSWGSLSLLDSVTSCGDSGGSLEDDGMAGAWVLSWTRVPSWPRLVREPFARNMGDGTAPACCAVGLCPALTLGCRLGLESSKCSINIGPKCAPLSCGEGSMR